MLGRRGLGVMDLQWDGESSEELEPPTLLEEIDRLRQLPTDEPQQLDMQRWRTRSPRRRSGDGPE
jgi:hypothetical protein